MDSQNFVARHLALSLVKHLWPWASDFFLSVVWKIEDWDFVRIKWDHVQKGTAKFSGSFHRKGEESVSGCH